MKKLLLLFVLTTLFSCSDSDEPVVIPQALIGKWQYVEYYEDYIEYDQDGNPIRYMINNGDVIEYRDDGTFVESSFEITQRGNFRVEGNTIIRYYYTGGNVSKAYQSYSHFADDLEQMYCSPTFDQPITDEIVFFSYFRLEKR